MSNDVDDDDDDAKALEQSIAQGMPHTCMLAAQPTSGDQVFLVLDDSIPLVCTICGRASVFVKEDPHEMRCLAESLGLSKEETEQLVNDLCT